MPTVRRHPIRILLGLLLAVAFVVVGRADQLAVTASADGEQQLHPETPFFMSAPIFEIKTGARKEGSSWKVFLAWITQRHSASPSTGGPTTVVEQGSAQIVLRDLETSRGRGPPRSLVS